ncbi:MAG TPA: Dam family site-specific DNA-(adenine-N6)-methyltransferase [Candidatus Angelobacter sp.]|nr:Dam family site-specific DNA-(adenine-N6)-methyltransferase [Candidatus Angelobacter sp.]
MDSVAINARIWTRSVVRWAGSKQKLLPTLLRCVPSGYRRYIEPFAGSACLFFACHPRRAVLGDINPELLMAYQTLREHPRQVYRAVAAMPVSRAYYSQMRSESPETLPPISRTARFIFLTRNCFNGVYRTNKAGIFNVPMGIRTGSLGSEHLFYRCAIALRAAEFRAGDFEKCMADVKARDFVYLDPPYAGPSVRFRGEYGYGTFCNTDLDRLFQSLCRVDRAGATFLLSYSDEISISDWKKKWFYTSIHVHRHVAGFSEHRRAVRELLITNRPELLAV